MPIRIDMEDALSRSGLKAKDVARQVGISETQFSLFRSGKIKGVRFSTLSRLCAVLACRLDEIMRYDHTPEDASPPPEDEDD